MLRPMASFVFHRVLGWRQKGVTPQTEKAVVFCYPHTSYWDGFVNLFVFTIYDGVGVFWKHGISGICGRLTNQILVGHKLQGECQSTNVADQFIKSKNRFLFIAPEGQ